MSMSNSRINARNSHSRNPQDEMKENEIEDLLNSVHFPPPRTPLNSIPDPSQYHKEAQESDLDTKDRHETTRAGRLLEKRLETLDKTANYTSTPRVLNRHGKAHSEPNSAQSTPARSGSRPSLGGAMGAYIANGPRSSQSAKGKEVNSYTCRVSRGISVANYDFSVEVPHFELDEDSSFWADHSVQVLIRIRPLSTMERVSQGCGRCLRQESAQTLVWLGHPETRFTFDHIACETTSQEKLFRAAGLPMVENCMSGYNSCMFAYGQTGSGKTYTMMGEINQVEHKLTEECGITPRIFEYLFSRIRMEEENRRDEKLRFSCKCSFLEIYNEQITDLLEPSSTNLQLREDLNKGVYVENLTEYNVRTVSDVIKLLLQGAANRKMAATYMNSESSRSHSVFTCVIESWWEKDSMNHFRFARLNLVDLAGSERQKSSGAEGDRLKEAANINKSLSTLGLVIMSLVDLAHGKHRHIPYRDSRLTFLLQDSLGGNSKTTIIANVSPSVCSAHETLSTLKFAQRAKLIQNNAKVNEDASGDVGSLQRQIQQLKDQLSFLMNHQNLSRPLSSCEPSFEGSSLTNYSETCNSSEERRATDKHNMLNFDNKKMNRMEGTLIGALRREKMAETALHKLEAEIGHLNQFARQREEDVQHTKMMLRFREEKIKQLELSVNGSLLADDYLMEENRVLKEEIQLLQARVDKNPELTRFALENIRLLQQLQLFQNFYEQGERETLLAEIAELRDQLLEALERKFKFSSSYDNEDYDYTKELEDCRNMNSKLMREVDELREELRKYLSCNHAAIDSVTDSFSKDPEGIGHTDKYLLVKTRSTRSDSGDEMASYTQADVAFQNENDQNMSATFVIEHRNTQKELMDARLLIEAMESEQVHLIEELQLMQEQDHMYTEILNKKDREEGELLLKLGSDYPELENPEKQNKVLVMEGSEDIKRKALQAKLDKLTKDLEEARLLNCRYEKDQASQFSQQHQVELVREQVEIETSRTILHLQEEVTAFQFELDERLCCMTQENMRLRNTIAAKEQEMKTFRGEWEKATLELTNFLVEGSKSLKDASGQIESIVCSFPQVNVWISEHVERAAKACIDKEEKIFQLEQSLEDAQKMVAEMELKLNSLREATIALNDLPQLDNDESIHLSNLLNEKINMVNMLESKLKIKEDFINEAEKHADAAFLAVKCLSDRHMVAQSNCTESGINLSQLFSPTKMVTHVASEMTVGANSLNMQDIEARVELESLILESQNAIDAFYMDAEGHIAALKRDILETFTTFMKLGGDLVKEIYEMRSKCMELKENHLNFESYMVKLQAWEPLNFLKLENQLPILHPIRDELAKMNEKLAIINDSINRITSSHLCTLADEYIGEADGWNADNSTSGYSTSGSDFLTESDVENKLDGISYMCHPTFSGKITEQMVDLKFHKSLVVETELEDSKKLLKLSYHSEAMMLGLRKDLDMVFDAFNKLYVHLTTILDDNDMVDCSYREEMKQPVPSFGLRMEIGGTCCQNTSKVIADDHVNHASPLLSKYEEARETMKEADYMLNALLKVNKNAKQFNTMWKQANEELMGERSRLIEENELLKSLMHLKEGENKSLLDEISHCLVERSRLIEENEQLKFLICLKGGENKSLLDEISHGLVEAVNSISLLEGCFLQMQEEVEERYKVLYSDALSMGKEMRYFICNSRSSMEDICSEVMEKRFELCVLHQCLKREATHKIPSFNVQTGFFPLRQQECYVVTNASQKVCLSDQDDVIFTYKKAIEAGNHRELVTNLEDRELDRAHDSLMYDYENLCLKEELERKEVLLKGLLFDFSLLQETASNRKDLKDETEKLILALSEVRQELAMKKSQFDGLLVQHRKVECCLMDKENALLISNSNLQQAKETLDTLSDQNAELRMLLKDLYLKKSEAEEQLEEQKETIKGLEREIIHLTSSAERKLCSSVERLEEDLRKVTNEREQLHEEICSLNDKLEMAYALADENEAIAVEARQESEASKIYAEQKGEEVKILEHSVEELESTINVLEKKVYEMDEEVERHHSIRDSLEMELQALRQRLSTVENFTDIVDSENTNSAQNDDPTSRQLHGRILELHAAHNQIRLLEKNIAEKEKEIKQCKEYISELVLHSEAQASQYQEQYKALEAMVHEVKTNLSNSSSAASTMDKNEKSSMRTRASSSPFRCIASLVQQMNLETDQELSIARLRIDELESVSASRQKEVCMLHARLATAESMTHDVIRDLLGVKLDLTNYANLIDQDQVQKLVEEAHQQTEKFLAKEQEILNLRKQINDLTQERESCMSEINKKASDILAAQMTVEQLQERDQLLSAQNEMLEMDKTNLLRRVAELDEMVKALFGTQSTQQQIQQISKTKMNGVRKVGSAGLTRRLSAGNADLTRRLAHSEKLLSRVNDELAQYCNSGASHPNVNGHGSELKHRKHQA